MSAVRALLDRLPRTTLVVGKGGVGKTTTAAALAVCAADGGEQTLVLSTDPARALPLVLGVPVAGVPTRIPGVGALHARSLDTAGLRARFLERWGGEIREILDRGTYLDQADIDPLVATALPGSDEIFAALELARVMADANAAVGADPDAADARRAERVIVDTAPTGHTLRLLKLPAMFRALVRLLDAMQSKHRFMVRALTRSYRADRADAFLAEMSALTDALDASLKDPSRCAAVLVTNPEPVVVEETQRYRDALRALGISVVAEIWNATGTLGERRATSSRPAIFAVPRLDPPPIGVDGLRRWARAVSDAPAGSTPRSPRRLPRRRARAARAVHVRATAAGAASPTELVRPLTIVAGKGGVGKTTVAAALGLAAAHTHRVLVVSTDPAPSLADVLGAAVPDADTPVDGAPRLWARQMDASAAFERMRREYQERVDALFDGLVTRGMDLAHDRAITRDLLSLAPPGVDELHALVGIADALSGDRYDRVVVDPAPTGHLLRLLEMPALALDWSHQIMRLMLKYKDVAGLGEAARDLLEFSRSVRGVEALFRDAERTGVVLVSLDEPVVQAETKRLAAAVRARGAAIAGLVRNRATGAAALPAVEVPMHFEAAAVNPAPRGVAGLRDWLGEWRAVEAEGEPVADDT